MYKSKIIDLLALTIGQLYSTKNYNRAITFHQIDTPDKYSLKMKMFKSIIQFLVDSGYNFKVISDIKNNTNFTEKNIYLTFDDGHISSLVALDYLISKNIKSTIFLVAKDYYKETKEKNSMTIPKNEIINLSNSKNIEIGSHSYSHTLLVNANNIKREIFDSKKILEDLVAKKICSFSIPYGKKRSFNDRILHLIKDAGFEYCCTQIPSPIIPNNKPFLVPRIGLWNTDKVDTVRMKINGNYDYLKNF